MPGVVEEPAELDGDLGRRRQDAVQAADDERRLGLGGEEAHRPRGEEAADQPDDEERLGRRRRRRRAPGRRSRGRLPRAAIAAIRPTAEPIASPMPTRKRIPARTTIARIGGSSGRAAARSRGSATSDEGAAGERAEQPADLGQRPRAEADEDRAATRTTITTTSNRFTAAKYGRAVRAWNRPRRGGRVAADQLIVTVTGGASLSGALIV